MTHLTASPNLSAEIEKRVAQHKIPLSRPLAMLLSRTLLFAFWQAVIALVFLLAGNPHPWSASIPYWVVSVTLGNLCTLALLSVVTRLEGMRLVDLYRVGKHSFWRELLIILALFIPLGPLAFFPGPLLTQWLYHDPQGTAVLMFQPLPLWVVIVTMILLPITVALSELPTYFAYAMPRLQANGVKPWLALLASGLLLSFQHVAFPLIFDWRFVIYRAFMFIFFALGIGLILQKRPRLLPYAMVIHALMDLSLFFFLLPLAY